jgi:hypothetical protein
MKTTEYIKRQKKIGILMKAENIGFGEKIKYGKDKTLWTFLSIDPLDKRFCFLRSDKTQIVSRVQIHKIEPVKQT